MSRMESLEAGNRIALKKKKIKAEYNSAGKDTVKRDNIPRKCQERKLAQQCARREQRKSAGETSPVFVNHRKWELNLHISEKSSIFAAGKRKTDNGGCRGKGQQSDVPVT